MSRLGSDEIKTDFLKDFGVRFPFALTPPSYTPVFCISILIEITITLQN